MDFTIKQKFNKSCLHIMQKMFGKDEILNEPIYIYVRSWLQNYGSYVATYIAINYNSYSYNNYI